MGRVSSRYNYRIAKTKKTDKKEPVKKILSPDKVVVRNRKTEATPKKSTANTLKKNKAKKREVKPVLKKANKRGACR